MRAKSRKSALLARAFESLPVAATVTDRKGRVLAVNREARRLAGPWRWVRAARTCRELWGCRLHAVKCPLVRAVRRGRTVYHGVVPTEGPRGRRAMIERVSLCSLPDGKRGAVTVSGPATAFLRRMRRLENRSARDGLTDLLNRARFDELSALRERRGGRAAFLMIDVDGLKRVNDREGHAAGDALLRRLAVLLSRHTRRGDVVGRVGGDEFAVYLPGADRARALALARRLRAAMRADNAARPDLSRLGASIGVASGRDGGATLRSRADAALYARKRGRARRPRRRAPGRR